MKNETKLIETADALEQARTALSDALADGDVQDITEARRAFDAAKQAHDDALLAQESLRRREVQAEQERIADAVAKQWAHIGKLADERDVLAAKIEKAIANLAEPFARLTEINGEILAALPARIDSDRAHLRHPHSLVIEALWRSNLLAGSPLSAWELDRKPTMTERFKEGGDYLRGVAK
jgi:hypothetical protein